MAGEPLRGDDIKQHNTKIILSNIYKARNIGGISQSELVSRTGLQASAVLRIFTNLENTGLICQAKEQKKVVSNTSDTKKGRKPVYYTICADSRFVIAVSFWLAGISIGIFDFSGVEVYHDSYKFNSEVNGEYVVDKMIFAIEKAIRTLDISQDKIIGIGVSSPGKVSLRDGRVVFYTRINGLEDYPLKTKLEDVFNVPVLVQNVCCSITYEAFQNAKMNFGSSVYSIFVRNGAGGAFVTENGIFVSSDGTTYEAGHVPIIHDGPLCECGLKGCLQACLLQLDKEFRNEDVDSPLLFGNLSDELAKQNPKALELVNKISYYIYLSIKQAQRIFAPESFLLVFSTLFLAEAVATKVKEMLKEDGDAYEKERAPIHYIAFSDFMAMQGARQLVLDNYLSD